METRRGRYLEGKHIFYSTSTYGFRRVKHYKVMEYDLDARKYTVINQDVDGPIEYIEILDEKNIEVYVEVIPMESSDDEDEDDVDMKDSVPFTAEDIRKMKQKELRQKCVEYEVCSYKNKTVWNSNSKMKEALMEKFGLEGSTTSDYQQKVEESSNALDAFLLLPVVVAITSTISKFNPKNKAHAASFMKQYRKKHGKGPTRSCNST